MTKLTLNLSNFKNIFIFILLLLLSLIPLLAFKDNYLIGASEHQTWLKSDYVLDDFFSLWSNRFNSLSLDSTQFYRFAALNISNFFFPDNEFNNQKFILLSFSFLQPFAIYLLFVNFFKELEYRSLGGFAAALFYTFNLFYLIHINLMLHHVNLILSFTPLIIVFLIRLFDENLNWNNYMAILYSLLISICFLPLASSANNPPNLIGVVILGLIFLIFYYKNNKSFLIKILNLFIIVILINSFWIFNAFVYWTSIYSFFTGEYTNLDITSNLNQWHLANKYYLNEFFRLTGLPAFESYWFYKDFENITLISFFSHLSALICFIGIFMSENIHKNQKKLLYVSLLIFLFLIKGINPPFGIYFRQIFDEFSFMYMFRNPAAKFGNAYIILLSLAYGYSIIKIYQIMNFKKFYKILLIVALIFSTTLLVGFPRLIEDKTILLDGTDHHIKIPTYWKDLEQWLILKKFSNSKMILLPESDRSTMYNLDGDLSVMSQPIAYQLLPNKLLWKKDYDYNYDQSEVNFAIMNIDNYKNFEKFLEDRNIQFILLQGDIVTDHFRYENQNIRSAEWHEDNLDKSNLFNKKKFGELTLYINKKYVGSGDFKIYNAIKPLQTVIKSDDMEQSKSIIKNLNTNFTRHIYKLLDSKKFKAINDSSDNYLNEYIGGNAYKISTKVDLQNQLIIFEGNYNKNWIIYESKDEKLNLLDRFRMIYDERTIKPFLFEDKAAWFFENLSNKHNYYVVFKHQYIFEILIQLSIYFFVIIMAIMLIIFIQARVSKQ